METAMKISNAGSSKRQNTMNNQTENSIVELHKNETVKIMPFSFFLSFETAEKLLGVHNRCYETVMLIKTSFDFLLNKTTMNETPKDISNFIVNCNSYTKFLFEWREWEDKLLVLCYDYTNHYTNQSLYQSPNKYYAI